jgi:hypothetical protein
MLSLICRKLKLKLTHKQRHLLGEYLGVTIAVEVKEKVDTNKIIIQIENAYSGLIYLQEKFNKNNTIKEMKEQVNKSLQSKKKEFIYDLCIYNDKRDKITTDESDTIDELFKDDDYPVLAVSFKIAPQIKIHIINAFSGKIILYLKVNKNNTIKEIKEQVKKSLQNKKGGIYNLRLYNENLVNITNDESNTIDKCIIVDDYPVLAVSYNIRGRGRYLGLL